VATSQRLLRNEGLRSWVPLAFFHVGDAALLRLMSAQSPTRHPEPASREGSLFDSSIVRNQHYNLPRSPASPSPCTRFLGKLLRPGGESLSNGRSHVETQKLQPNVAPSPLIQRLKLSTRGHRRCPYCFSGRVYRERCEGFQKLTSMLGIRPHRCLKCDRLHYGFAY
jgi:hypothetical protein